MPMKMGIHRKPIGHSRLAFLDSRLRGNDGGFCPVPRTGVYSFPKNA